MLIIPITKSNTELLMAVNDGVLPEMPEERNPQTWTYLVMDTGETNRIIDQGELLDMYRNSLVLTVTTPLMIAS